MYLALGIFDGVHLGHRKVIEKAHLVVTFDPHPNLEKLLTTVAERQELIKNLQVIKFSEKLKNQTPQEFIIKNILKYHPEKIFIGTDFQFGKDRSGNADTLKELGAKYNFTVEVVEDVRNGTQKISSTLIRNLLQQSKIELANTLLGRQYSLVGKIVKGQQIARKLGFPTINLKTVEQKLYPGEGSYSGQVIVNNRLYQSAIFVGKKLQQTVMEAHLINYNDQGSLYGKPCKIFLEKFIRPCQQFTGEQKLIAAIGNDVNLIANNFQNS